MMKPRWPDSRSIYRIYFNAFIAFAILYNGYRYFFPWGKNFKPIVPLYFSIVKDIPWAIAVVWGLYLLIKSRPGNPLKDMSQAPLTIKLFVSTHIGLLGVAVLHLAHKSPIDILQRDVKNVQYIFLPLLFPYLVRKNDDVRDYINWVVGIGMISCIFGFITYAFIQGFTWDGAVLSTFQSPITYGYFTVMLFLVYLPRVFLKKGNIFIFYIVLFILYGATLTSSSFSAILSLIVGAAFLITMLRPPLRVMAKVGLFLLVASLVFYSAGLYDKHLDKIMHSYSDASRIENIKLVAGTTETSKEQKAETEQDLWDTLKTTHYPKSDGAYEKLPKYTTFSGRKAYAKEFFSYMGEASFTDILLGDFSLGNYFEYDNVYFYFTRNDGIIVTIMFFVLFMLGASEAIRKYRLFCKADNAGMAGLSLGIAGFLLTAALLEFNLSYFLTIYPLNFFTYFFLLLIFYIDPGEGAVSGQ